MIIFFLSFFIFLLNAYLLVLQENIDYKKRNFDFSLYGKKYAHEFDDLEFKIFLANKTKKNILLGSSTSMTFRPDLLNANYFNSSKGNIKMSEIKYFLKNLKYDPKNIIIFIDPYHFNKNFPEISKSNIDLVYKFKHNIYSSDIKFYYYLQKNILIFAKFGQVIKDFKKNYLQIFTLEKNDKKIGFNAKLFNSGFRKDGSFKYPDQYLNDIRVDENEAFDLTKYSKSNLYFGENNDFTENYESKLSFLVSKNINYKKKILVVLNVVESNFLSEVKSNKNYNQFIKKYKNICKYLIENDIKCIDKVEFAYESKINSNLFFDPFHYRYKLSNLILKDVLEYTK